MRLLLSFLFPLLALAGSEEPRCVRRVHGFTIKEAHPQNIWFEGGLVTGGDRYPLATILKNLEIDEAALEAMRGQPVLLVGEGYSQLLPFLLANSVRAKALDLVYHLDEYPANLSGQLLANYVAQYGAHLIRGSANQIDLPNGSQQRVYSHLMMNNIHSPALFAKATEEMLRVLAPGGQASIFGYDFEAREVEREYRARGYEVSFTSGQVTKRSTAPELVTHYGLRFTKPISGWRANHPSARPAE